MRHPGEGHSNRMAGMAPSAGVESERDASGDGKHSSPVRETLAPVRAS